MNLTGTGLAGSGGGSQSSDVALTVRNPGSNTVTVNSVTNSNPAFTAALSPAPPFTIEAGGTRTLTVRYTPKVVGLEQSAITFNLVGGSAILNLTGTGVATSVIAVTPSPVDFGTVAVGQTKDSTVLIANRGAGVLAVQSHCSPP